MESISLKLPIIQSRLIGHSRPRRLDGLPIVSFSKKEQQEREHWTQLKQQLIENRLKFSTGPLLAHVQFSNYCNLSCIMCWNGKNPRTKKLPQELLNKLQSQLGPHLSVMVPFSGSEPLILTWDETRQMAEDYGVLLRITSNLQFLDEQKFFELKEITETLCLSLDTHIPEVLEKIRTRVRTDDVLNNLTSTVRLAREHRLECIVNVVLMTYNAPFLSDTIRYLASIGVENVDVIQMVDINRESHFIDPLAHFSDEYLDWIKSQTVEACRDNQMRLLWNVGRHEVFDFREDPVPANGRKATNDHNDWLLKHYVPGFCKHAYNRMRVDLEGDVAPCFLATEGELTLGNLNEADLDQIWNGTNARDLRRGMYTDDVPVLCRGCRMRQPLLAQPRLPFQQTVIETKHTRFFKHGIDANRTLVAISPTHMFRADQAPTLRIHSEFESPKFLVALALGGSGEDHCETFSVNAKSEETGTFDIQIPRQTWARLKPNLGYWWSVWQSGGRKTPAIKLNETRCLIKHRPIERIAGSTLRYNDEDWQETMELGLNKPVGFESGK